jgi:hypothetical protein
MSTLQKLFNSGKYFLNTSESFLETVNKPLILYNIFVIALICYNAVKSDWYAAAKNTVFLALGSVFIWLLVFLGFEPIAWVLITLPFFFVIAILALLVLTQIIKTDVSYSNNEMMLTGIDFKKLFGLSNSADEQKEFKHDMTTGFFAPKHPDKANCKRPAPPRPVHITPPPIAVRKIVEPECTTCVFDIIEEESEN